MPATHRCRRSVICLLLACACAQAAQSPLHTYANPIDIDYRYNFEQVNEKISYRTGADPVFVRHGDAYYLFQTLADGYWRSNDLLHWRFVTPSRWPFESVIAPAAVSDGERLIVMPSMMDQRAVMLLTDPAAGEVDFLTRRMGKLPDALPPGQDIFGIPEGRIPPGPWDPALFADRDGRWYLYWARRPPRRCTASRSTRRPSPTSAGPREC